MRDSIMKKKLWLLPIILATIFCSSTLWLQSQDELLHKVEQYQHTIDSLSRECEQIQWQIAQNYSIQKQEKEKQTRIYLGLTIFILLDIVGMVFFLYLQQKRAYITLAKKNLEWAERSVQSANFLTALDKEHLEKDEERLLEMPDKQNLIAIIKMLRKDKLYLNSDLTINDVAQSLGTTRNIVSKLINTYFHKSFPALLNEYRINEAIFLLKSETSYTYTLEAIGEMCGYKNRQVFHNAFKKITGVTPNVFRTMALSKEFSESETV
jgi:YesN/AraC family two-component response regulator